MRWPPSSERTGGASFLQARRLCLLRLSGSLLGPHGRWRRRVSCWRPQGRYPRGWVRQGRHTFQLLLTLSAPWQRRTVLEDERENPMVQCTQLFLTVISLPFNVSRTVLEDERENPMVRHEAAEALGAIADNQCIELLRKVCPSLCCGAKPRAAVWWSGANDQIALLPAWLLQCHFRLLKTTSTLTAGSSKADRMCSLKPPVSLFPPIAAQYATHPEPIVADSCIVALDMLDFEQSGSFSYADTGAAAGGEAAAVQAAA